MFAPGNILHGEFDLGTEKKEKFAIVLYNDGVDCILTTFTTSQERSTEILATEKIPQMVKLNPMFLSLKQK